MVSAALAMTHNRQVRAGNGCYLQAAGGDDGIFGGGAGADSINRHWGWQRCYFRQVAGGQ